MTRSPRDSTRNTCSHRSPRRCTFFQSCAQMTTRQSRCMEICRRFLLSDARSLIFPKHIIIDNWATVLGTMSRMAPQVMLNLFLSNPRMIDDLVRPTYRHLSALVQFIDAVGMHGSSEMRNVVAARLCATNAWHCMRTLLLKNQPSVILCTVCRLAYEMAQLVDDRAARWRRDDAS